MPTRFNPRKNFGTQEELVEFGQVLAKRQLQPAVVVSRAAYLKLWPDEAEAVGSAPYVIANGERRYRGSLAAGLTHLHVVQREEVAQSKAVFLDAVLSENIDRKNLDPIEQALGIETMVQELGSARQVAEHYQRHETWVSQQRKLLKLTPELQQLVSTSTMPVRVARDIAGLPRSEQGAAWAAEAKAREAAAAIPRVRRREAPAAPVAAQPAATSPAPENSSGGSTLKPPQIVLPSTRSPEEPGAEEPVLEPAERGADFTAVKPSSNPPADNHDQPPMHRPTSDAEPVAVVMPWHNPTAVTRILREYMEPEDLRQLSKELAELI
ncbi:ParB/RepB/Spo0J family partition protein (plasmid) [Streptomyces sp. LZ34]